MSFESSEREIKSFEDKEAISSPKEKEICIDQLKTPRNHESSLEIINISRIPRKESYSEVVHSELAGSDDIGIVES